jgi:hypothetical protein
MFSGVSAPYFLLSSPSDHLTTLYSRLTFTTWRPHIGVLFDLNKFELSGKYYLYILLITEKNEKWKKFGGYITIGKIEKLSYTTPV